MPITRNFTLYLNAGISVAPTVHVNQYDRGEQWVFTLLDDKGQKYTPSSGALIGVKADGNAIAGVTGTVGSNGDVYITETQQMTAAAGKAIFELTIDGMTHGTANFIVQVEKKPTDDAVLSESDLSIIQQGIDSVTPAAINETVSEYLAEHMTNPPIDPTLTVRNAAADAKVTGDKITDLKSDLSYLGEFGKRTVNGTFSIYMPTTSGKRYTITNIQGGTVSLYLSETKNGTSVQTVSSGLQVGNSVTFESNQDTQFIAGWCPTDTTFTIVEESSRIHKYDKHGEYITLLSEGKYPVNLISGGYISADGSLVVNQYYMYSDYIDCSEAEKIRVVTPVDRLRYCCWYSEDKTLVRSFTIKQGDNEIAVPEGFAFCRISGPTATMKAVSVYTVPYVWISEVNKKADENATQISALQNGFVESNELGFIEWEQGTINGEDVEATSQYFIRTKYIYCANLSGVSYTIASGYYVMWYLFDIERNIVGKHRTWTDDAVIPIDDNVAFIRIIIAGDNTEVVPSDANNLISVFGFDKVVKSIPSYWANHIEEKIDSVRGLQKTCGSRGDSFVFITDYHDSINGLYNCNVSPNLICKIMQKTSTRFVVFGGDGFDHESTIGAYREGQYRFYDKFNYLKAGQFFPVIGNHEFYSDLYTGTAEDIMTAEEAYNINLKRYENSFADTDYLKSYCFDNKVQKIRYIVMGCNYNSEISNEQIAWFMGQLLNIPTGYSVFLITHSGTYIDTQTSELVLNSWYQTMMDALDALKMGYSIEVNGTTYDFLGKQREVICALSGHIHADMNTSTAEGIPIVVRSADKINVNRTKGTITEQSFDVVSIDMTRKKIYFTKVGAGNSAMFNY